MNQSQCEAANVRVRHKIKLWIRRLSGVSVNAGAGAVGLSVSASYNAADGAKLRHGCLEDAKVSVGTFIAGLFI